MKRILTFISVLSICSFAVSPVVAQEQQENGTYAGYDGAFYIQNASKSFQLKIGGGVRLQYELAHGTQPISSDGNDWENTFMVRGARLFFTGTAYEKMDFSMTMQYSTVGSCDAETGYCNTISWWVETGYKFAPAFKLGFGLVGQPGDFFGSSFFIEDTITGTLWDGKVGFNSVRPAFNLGSDVGTVANGDIGRFHYGVYFGNGNQNPNQFNTNLSMSFSGGAWVDILKEARNENDREYSKEPGWSIGAGGGFNEAALSNGAPVNDPTMIATYDRRYNGFLGTAFKYKGFGILANGYWQWLRVDHSACNTAIPECNMNVLTDFAFRVSTAYFLVPKKFAIGARYAQIFRQGPDNNAFQAGGGVNWYILDEKFMFQADYDYIVDYDNIPGYARDKQNYFRLQFSTYF